MCTVTVEHAYALLCDEGYAEARERSGYFVIFRKSDGFASSASTTVPMEKRPLLSSEYTSFSLSILSKTIRKVLADYYDVILEKSPNSGCVELRYAIKQYLMRNRSINADIDQIVIGSGAEYLYGLIIDLIGRDNKYANESPSYEKIEHI